MHGKTLAFIMSSWSKRSVLFLVGLFWIVGAVEIQAYEEDSKSKTEEAKELIQNLRDSETGQQVGEVVQFVQSSQEKLAESLDNSLGQFNGWIFKVLFFDLAFGALQDEVTDPKTGEVSKEGPKLPFLVVYLAIGAVFFTLYHRFINLRGFRHAIEVVRGKYNKGEQEGDITPFRALTSALSATVGLGNIAGVAVAMVLGGPGALFWMMFLGLFGMTSKFHESTLAQMYRTKNPDGTISGGPMFYLSEGLGEMGGFWKPAGKIIAVVFAVFCMGASLGGGNMFQANQAFEGFFTTFVAPVVTENTEAVRIQLSFGFGFLMAALVAVVVIGGITRIGAATSRIVPFMAVLYVSACAIIVGFNLPALPGLIGLVLSEAFQWDSAYGGVIGAMMVGFQRAAFSSEAGLGSSAIAHSAAKTSEPVREGLVANLEPFIDTIVVCFMTGMVVLITGAYQAEGVEGGAAVTLYAFKQVPALSAFFPSVLSICIILFAFSTMLSWCYYGERAWGYLFGIHTVLVFRLIFVVFVFIGTVVSLGAVIDFADAMLLSMALPNIFGGVLLAGKVKAALAKYLKELKDGEFEKDVQDYEI
ncbi:MAG: alanine/glycine:cation symporter family protein [Verrucomicrobiota bacterium]